MKNLNNLHKLVSASREGSSTMILAFCFPFWGFLFIIKNGKMRLRIEWMCNQEHTKYRIKCFLCIGTLFRQTNYGLGEKEITLKHTPCDQSTLNSFRSLYGLYSTFVIEEWIKLETDRIKNTHTKKKQIQISLPFT